MVDPNRSHHWRGGGPITGAGPVPCSSYTELAPPLATETVDCDVRSQGAGTRTAASTPGRYRDPYGETDPLSRVRSSQIVAGHGRTILVWRLHRRGDDPLETVERCRGAQVGSFAR